MHLYITASSIKVEVGGITLRDGYVPVVSGHAPSDTGHAPSDTLPAGDDVALEPAVWFKVLALESLCIDCSHRVGRNLIFLCIICD